MASSEPAQVTRWPDTPYPIGATYDGAGTNFSVFSEVADRVEPLDTVLPGAGDALQARQSSRDFR